MGLIYHRPIDDLMRVAAAMVFLSFVLIAGACQDADLSHKASMQQGVDRIHIDGSTTLYPAFEEISTSYHASQTNISIENTASSSGAGVENLIAGRVEIARSSRELTDQNRILASAQGGRLQEIQVGRDAVVVITHPSKSRFIEGLTFDQLRGIFFHGSVNNWSQINPKLGDVSINVYVRDADDSGTGYLFNQKLVGSPAVPFVSSSLYLKSTPKLLQAVAKDPNGISFLPASMLNDRVKALAIGRTVDSYTSYQNSDYPLVRNLYLVVMYGYSETVQSFLDFVTGPVGQDILTRYHLRPGATLRTSEVRG